MKRMLLVGCVLAVTAAPAPAQNNPKKDKFLELNPGYQQRAGGFYEQSYLPGAIKSMVPAVNSPQLKEQQAEDVLKDLIYTFLDAYVEGGGEISRAERARVLAKIDRRVQDLVKDKAAYERYLGWRKNTPRDQNPLQFLFALDVPLAIRLPPQLAAAGWTMEPIDDLVRLEAYKGYLGQVPDQVVRFVHAKAGKADKAGAWLTVVVYPAGYVREALQAHQSPLGPWTAAGKAGGPALPPLELFWQTRGYLVFSAEGPSREEQARLASAIKLQLNDR